MAKDKKVLSEKEISKRVKDLKIELLKSPTKKASVKKEIARLLTMKNLTKSTEDVK
jgi:ribosomal protein L29